MMKYVRRCPLPAGGTVLVAVLVAGLASAPVAGAAPIGPRSADQVDKSAAMRVLEAHGGTGPVGAAKALRDALARAHNRVSARDTVAPPSTVPSAVAVEGTAG